MKGCSAPTLLLAGLGLLACAPPPPGQIASASPAPAPAPAPAGGVARLPLTLNQPLGMPGSTRSAAAEPAPVPNRDIEAPPDRRRDPLAPRIEPMVLQQDRPQGMTFGSEHIRDASPDRSLENLIPGMGLPLNDVLPGARVRIPFE